MFIFYLAFLLNLLLPLVAYFGFFFLAVLGLHCCTQIFSSFREWGLLSSCGAQASLVVSYLVAEHGLQGAGASVAVAHGSVFAAPGLWSTGSVVVAHELICSSACGIFLDQGLNPCLLHWQPQGKPHFGFLIGS